MSNVDDFNKHFILNGVTSTERYQAPRQMVESSIIPTRDRQCHGSALLSQIESLKPLFNESRSAHEQAGFDTGSGLMIEFEGFDDIELAFNSLSRENQGIELLNVRKDPENEHKISATVFVPDGKLVKFENIITAYLEERCDRNGKPRDHRKLIDTIQDIRAASLRALWTDDFEVFPVAGESLWWEVWLPIRNDRTGVVSRFKTLAESQGLSVAPGEIRFPERSVLLIHASPEDMQRSMMTLNSVAELRRSKETADFFDGLSPAEQFEWQAELLDRCHFAADNDSTPYICLLDTGVNNGHPLITSALSDTDLHSVNPEWGTNDNQGHGTGMAGLALMGNISNALEAIGDIEISHRLESVKLLDHNGDNDGDPVLHGYLTVEAVSRPEITDPNRLRVFSMPVTARDNRDRGRPSAWSAALDRLAFDGDGINENPRLFCISAGNIEVNDAWANYPESNSTDGIHDPAQAWNVLTVGAYTELSEITEADAQDYRPVASSGGLSPFSTTSMTWEPKWPLKPDVVFEGGNAAKDNFGAVTMPSLSLLTTHNVPSERLFTTTNATSAATSLAAHMAAQIMAGYPELRPETIRALIVHSAEWTDEMKRLYLPVSGRPNKSDFMKLVRHCGFGVPDLNRALWSVANSLTLVIEESLNPFQKTGNGDPTLKDMHVHRLPWPNDELEALLDAQVEMRVTLSYFIEPNPSARGFGSRYCYESHGLRFDVSRPNETDAAFRARINVAARDEEDGVASGGVDSGWMLGKKQRHRGSIHSDTWRGTAADLASRGVLAVYPTLGWWKTRVRHEKYDNPARYALVVSIRAPEIDIDLYNAVANRVALTVSV